MAKTKIQSYSAVAPIFFLPSACGFTAYADANNAVYLDVFAVLFQDSVFCGSQRFSVDMN
jgi:hypothetical protein